MLSRLIYRSKGDISSEEFSQILRSSRAHNAVAGATGVLFHKRPHFIQILEGSRDVLSRLFLRIAVDRRHEDVTLMDMRAISERVFPHWSMADLSIIILDRDAWRRIGSTAFEPETMSAEGVLSLLGRLATELAATNRQLAVS